MENSFNRNLHLNASGRLYQYARELRAGLTPAEEILWQHLRNRKLAGLKFRRQHPLVEFVADFYCHEKRLVIELDGSVHDNEINKDYDQARTNWLGELNIMVIRFRNYEIHHNLDFVLSEIRKCVTDIETKILKKRNSNYIFRILKVIPVFRTLAPLLKERGWGEVESGMRGNEQYDQNKNRH